MRERESERQSRNEEREIERQRNGWGVGGS